MMRIKSDKMYTLKPPHGVFDYEDVWGNHYKVVDGFIKMPRLIALAALRISDNFEFIEDSWEWADEGGNKLLLLRGGGLGDIMLLTPVLTKLYDMGIEVTLATQIKYFDLIDTRLCALIDLEKYPNNCDLDSYDAVVDLHQTVEEAEWDKTNTKHRSQLFADVLKLDLENNYKQTINTTNIVKRTGYDIFYVKNSSCNNRNWSEAKHEKFIKRLREYYKVEVSGRYDTVNELMSYVYSARLVITPDTGVFHLAQALGKKVLTYFGAFPIARRASDPKNFINLVTNQCPDVPCLSYGCPYIIGEDTPPCIDVPIESMLAEVYQLLPVS